MWSSSTNPLSMSRIDQVVVSMGWKEHFMGVTQRVLRQVVSEHSPIMVEAGGMLRGEYFEFENM